MFIRKNKITTATLMMTEYIFKKKNFVVDGRERKTFSQKKRTTEQ